jgi:regulator of protease activity HflC (stomatin/prohibitin superfamily)
MAELDAILKVQLASSNPPSGAATPPRRPPHRADRITRNMTAGANAWPSRKEISQANERERTAIIEGERERQLIAEAERYAELAYLRAKGAA